MFVILGNSDAASIVEALAGDGEGHLVPTPVRREKIKASKRELALEADRVLKQADSVASLHSDVPPRRQPRSKPVEGEPNQSLQRKTSFGGTDSKKWNSEGKSWRGPNYYFETYNIPVSECNRIVVGSLNVVNRVNNSRNTIEHVLKY